MHGNCFQIFGRNSRKIFFAQVVANCSLFSLLALPAVKSNSFFPPPDGGIALVGEFGEKMLQHSLNSDFGVALAMALGTKRAKNIYFISTHFSIAFFREVMHSKVAHILFY